MTSGPGRSFGPLCAMGEQKHQSGSLVGGLIQDSVEGPGLPPGLLSAQHGGWHGTHLFPADLFKMEGGSSRGGVLFRL